MDLNQLAFTARKRSAWEVFDLSVLLVKKHFFMMTKIVLALYVPLFILFSLFFSTSTVGFLLWWLKPIIERPLIDYLAKISFSQPTTVWSCISSIKQIKLKDAFILLTLYRLSPNRAYLAPISQLEKLHGKNNRSRKNILLGRCNHKQGLWITLCVHIEAILSLLFLTILYTFIPQGIHIDEQFAFQSISDGRFEQVYTYCYILASIIVMPYFVSGGFLTYINSRIKLEGWDIELAFKRIVKSKLTVLVVLFSLTLTPPTYIELHAEEVIVITKVSEKLEAAKKTKEAIKTLYEENEFIEKQETWQPIAKKEDQDVDLSWLKYFEFLSFLGPMLSYIAWLAVIVFVLWLGVFLYRHRGKFSNASFTSKKKQKIKHVNEVPIFLDKLPKNIKPNELLALAEEAKNQQDFRTALMYLLRFSLVFSQQNSTVKLHKSMSETECLQALIEVIPKSYHLLYQQLFTTWIQQAWAHKNAEVNTINDLISEFTLLLTQEGTHE